MRRAHDGMTGGGFDEVQRDAARNGVRASDCYEIRRLEPKHRRLKQLLAVAISLLAWYPVVPWSYRIAVIDLSDGRCVVEIVEHTDGATEALLQRDLNTLSVAEFERAWGLQ